MATLQIVSKSMTGLGIYDFLTAGTRMNTSMAASGASHDAITLKELLAGVQYSGANPTTGKTAPLQKIGENLQESWLPMVFSLAGVKVVDKILTKVGFNRSFNRIAKSVGLNTLVRA